MAEAKHPEKHIFSELSEEMKEKALEAMFVKYRQIMEDILGKDGETNKSRRSRNRAGVKGAAGPANGKPSDGKASRVERATKPAFESDRLGPPPPPGGRTGPPRGGRGGRGGSGGNRRPRHVAGGSSSVKF